MTTATVQPSALSWFLSRGLLKTALIDSFRRLTPRYQWRNPVMFVVYIGAILTTILWFQALGGKGEAPSGFILAVTLWLWVTLLFANFAEAVAEGRSKAQAASLRGLKTSTPCRRLKGSDLDGPFEEVPATALRKGDLYRVEAGQIIGTDGEVIAGIASVDESAITGESAPVIRAAGEVVYLLHGGSVARGHGASSADERSTRSPCSGSGTAS